MNDVTKRRSINAHRVTIQRNTYISPHPIISILLNYLGNMVNDKAIFFLNNWYLLQCALKLFRKKSHSQIGVTRCYSYSILLGRACKLSKLMCKTSIHTWGIARKYIHILYITFSIFWCVCAIANASIERCISLLSNVTLIVSIHETMNALH